jgi:hypothetical protein
MVAGYDFESPESLSDNLITDWSANAFDGTLSSVGTGANQLTADVPASLAPWQSQSLRLVEAGNPNGSKFAVPMSSSGLDFRNQDWSASVWFKRATTTNNDFVFYLGNSDGFGGLNELQLHGPATPNTFILRHYYGPNLTDVNLTATISSTTDWTHAAIVYVATGPTNGIMSLYANGSFVDSATNVALNLPTNMQTIFGGHANNAGSVDRWFNGSLDDAAIFKRALTPTEVAQLASRPVRFLGGLSASNTVQVTINAPATPTLNSQWGAGGFQLTVGGNAGFNYSILTSTNLSDWTPLLVTNPAAMPFNYTVTETNDTQRYFRVQLNY